MRDKRDLEPRRDRALAAGLAFALALALAATPAEARGRRGASVLVTTKAGTRTGGELIAVKPDSLLVLDSSGRDQSIALADVESVEVAKNPKLGRGLLYGFLIGTAAGIGTASACFHNADPCESAFAKAGVTVLGSLAGLLGGGIAGSFAGRDLKIVIPEATSPARAATLLKLRKYSRVGSPL